MVSCPDEPPHRPRDFQTLRHANCAVKMFAVATSYTSVKHDNSKADAAASQVLTCYFAHDGFISASGPRAAPSLSHASARSNGPAVNKLCNHTLPVLPPKRLDLGKGYPQSGLPFPAQKPSMRQCPTLRRQHGGPFGEDPAQSHQRKSRATHHSSIPVAGDARLERRESHVSQFPRRNSTRMLMRGRQPFRSRPHSAVSPRSRSGQTYVSSHRRRQRRYECWLR